jgi:hypothetical protein
MLERLVEFFVTGDIVVDFKNGKSLLEIGKGTESAERKSMTTENSK